MKKRKTAAWVLAAVLSAGIALAGCGGNTEEAQEEEVQAEPETEETQEETALQEIGDPSASLEVPLTNKMDGVIIGLAVKEPTQNADPDNMMTSDQRIEDGETVEFFYEPAAKEESEAADSDSETADSDAGTADSDAEATPTLQVTMENGDVYELSHFDVEDMEEVTLYLDEGVAYMKYRSRSQNALINTKEWAQEEVDEEESAQESATETTETVVVVDETPKPSGEAVDSEAYKAGEYCGEEGYLESDAKDRAAELGYAEGSKSYEVFWDAYITALSNRDGGDSYAIGREIGQKGLNADDAWAEYDADGMADPKSQYVRDFWEGYYTGYGEYADALTEANTASNELVIDYYDWGYSMGSAGVDWDDAKSQADDVGLVPGSVAYSDFSNGYDVGSSEYWNDYYESQGIELPGG